MPFHLLWFVFVLAFLVAPVAVIVILVVALTRRGGQAHPPVTYSPDGRWWWDGRQWQPAPHPPLPPQT